MKSFSSVERTLHVDEFQSSLSGSRSSFEDVGALRFATLASCCFAIALSEGACCFALDRVVGAVGAASYITCTTCTVSSALQHVTS